MFFTKRKNEQAVTLHPQTFHGREFSYSFDEINNRVVIPSYNMRRYELTNEAATDLENWFRDQKGKFERSKRLYREFGVVAVDGGNERPELSEWYDSLSDEYKQHNIRVINIKDVEYEEIISDQMKRNICGDYMRYLPEYGYIHNPEEDNKEESQRIGLIVITENGTRYVSPKVHEVKSSISSNYQDQLWNDPKHMPTVEKWWKSIGGKVNGMGVKKEQFREPHELRLEIDLGRYKY
jgi:hypothetical protein